jgi:hypothetical protein
MKQLYFLLILTLSFGVYSQGVFTYNFDAKTDGTFKTAIDASESSWQVTNGSGTTNALAGYVSVLGNAAPSNAGCIVMPGDKLPKLTVSGANTNNWKKTYTSNLYTARFPNTTKTATTPLNITGKVHFSVALQGYQITQGSGNEYEFKLRAMPNARVIATIKLQEDPNNAGSVRFVGNIFDGVGLNNWQGAQKTAGTLKASTASTLTVLGVTVDLTAGTWEFWTNTPESIDDLVSAGGGQSGNFGSNGTTALPTDTKIDHMQFVVKYPCGGVGTNKVTQTTDGTEPADPASPSGNVGDDDYLIVDQIKVSAPNYVNTLSIDDFADDNSFNIYPNPADNFIVFQNAKVGDKVDLFDVVGKKVKSFNVESEIQQMDISELRTGVYFARSNQQEAIKIIKR